MEKAARSFLPMQMTIDVPEDLAAKLQAARDRLPGILEEALASRSSFGLAGEMIQFLAKEPTPDQIIAFKASQQIQRRAQELLEKNREGTLAPEDEAEMDEIEALDNFFAVLRARAKRSAQRAA